MSILQWGKPPRKMTTAEWQEISADGAPPADGPGRVPEARTVDLHPGRQDVGSALTLFGAIVKSAVAFKTGTFRLVLDHFRLTVRADPYYGAWNEIRWPPVGIDDWGREHGQERR